jgi:NAD(P)-dependent dehydrogenase (short-subunit alcohol dehydrogenase family)
MNATAQQRLAAFGLDGKVAVVTGAASGIGAATAELFAGVGAKVVIGDLNGEGAEATAAAIRDAGGQAIGVQADVTDEVAVKALFDRARQEFGPVDVLVNNAAGRTKAAFMEMSVAEWDGMHAVTVRSAFLCSREAIRQMIDAGRGGAIVNISSVASVHPMIFNNAHYDSAKAGVNALTRDCAIEFAQHGVRVNAVLPGGTATPGSGKISTNAALPLKGPVLGEGRRPFGRQAQPSEMAHAILFLASPAASFITGQLLPVDGGFLVS